MPLGISLAYAHKSRAPLQKGLAPVAGQSELLNATRTVEACKLKRIKIKRNEREQKRKKKEDGERMANKRTMQSKSNSGLKDQQGYWQQRRRANEIKGEQTSYGQTISNGPKGHWIRTTAKGAQRRTTMDKRQRTRNKGHGTRDKGHKMRCALLKAISFW